MFHILKKKPCSFWLIALDGKDTLKSILNRDLQNSMNRIGFPKNSATTQEKSNIQALF